MCIRANTALQGTCAKSGAPLNFVEAVEKGRKGLKSVIEGPKYK